MRAKEVKLSGSRGLEGGEWYIYASVDFSTFFIYLVVIVLEINYLLEIDLV